MNLKEIESHAIKEISTEEKGAVLQKVRDAIAMYPEGTSVIIERVLMPWIVATCDDKKVPAYAISSTDLIVASTYRNLFKMIKGV